MKLSRQETLILGLIASVMCFTLVAVGGIAYFAMRQTPLPSTAIVGQNVATATQLPQNTAPAPATNTPQPPTETAAPVPPTNTREPTRTREPTNTPLPSDTPIPPTATPTPIGTLKVDQWELVITKVLADPGKDASRQNVIIFALVTNHGSQGTFLPDYTIELLDSKGRRYTVDLPATFSAQDKYGVDTYAGVSMSPESTELVLFAYETPAGERTFTLVPGDLVGSWSGNLTFTLP